MNGRFAMGVLSLLLAHAALPRVSAALYEVPEYVGEFVGAWDVNILADDVHFPSASILRDIRMPLAIAGVQTCTLWIFDALSQAPIYTVSFSNRPAVTNTDSSVYVFPMQLQVPKDIYVGFSAQGGGWGVNASDYWGRGFVVEQGVAGTGGTYYYGPVSGGQLTTLYSIGDGSFGCLEISAYPVQVEQVEAASGQVTLDVTSLPVYGSNIVERCDSADGTNWVERGVLPMGASTSLWSESESGDLSAFYRIRTR